MTSATPKVSVIIPTYNRDAYLPATLDTLTHQTLAAPYEVIVVDDGSTDMTREAVASCLGCNVRYKRIEHAGLPAPINRGIELARGEYVMLANDHDLYAPEMLAALSEVLDAHPSADLAVSDVVLVTPDASREIATYAFPYAGFVEGRRFLVEQLLPGIGSIASCNLFRREALRCEALDASYGANCDAELWLRLASRGDIVHVPRPLVRVRDRDANSAYYLTNYDLVRQALRAKRAYMAPELDPGERQAIEVGWRRRVDRSAAVSLWRALEAQRPDAKPAIRNLASTEGTRFGALAIDFLSRLPNAVSLALLRSARHIWGENR